MKHASGTVAPLDPELIQAGDVWVPKTVSPHASWEYSLQELSREP